MKKPGLRVRERAKALQGEAVLESIRLIKSICRPLGLHDVYRSMLVRLIRQTGLFDRAYYLEINSDVAQSEKKPLRHYAAYGDREGRSPMPFFDPAYYRAHARGRTKHVNALLHYALVGRYRRISPSPWFDVEYYLRHNKDVARAGLDPLLHYLKYGGLEGRSPCAQFDGSYYLRSNPDVVEARINPLLHYLLYGRLEKRRTLPEQADDETAEMESGEIPQPSLPTEEAWSALKPRAYGGQPAMDVVVPVYKGRVETLRCLYSVLAASSQTPFELIVINDSSPDKELVGDLQRLAARGLFTLISNMTNRGFVYTANLGMTLHSDRDVVLLNSDTEVYDGWLDRLRAAAQRNKRTGTVTPLSNNAVICSYPRFLHDNPFPLELSYAELDALMADVNSGKEAEAPTGVGFCLYIKRACLVETGLFDKKAFGKGYGEENDFCQRALAKGWRSVITADVFVHHWGAASFQGEKAKRIHRALKVMDKRHPRYQQDVDAFIRLDPLAGARRRVDWARIKRMRREKNILIVSHNRGGGTERHIQEDIQRLTREGYGIFRLRPVTGKPSHAVLSHPAIKSLPNLEAFALADIGALKETLAELGITEVHTHTLVDFGPDAPEHMVSLVRALGARYEVNLHDYKIICPRINLVDENGRYCGEPGEAECNRCLEVRGSDFGVLDISAWIEMHRRGLSMADVVLVPDQDMADRLSRYLTGVKFEVSPHEEVGPQKTPAQWPDLREGEKLRVAVIGAIGKMKGFDVLHASALHARDANLPLEFVVLGYSMHDRLLEDAGVKVTGKYQEHESLDALKKLKPHLVWLPSLWPETYSYTLSLALQTDLPILAFDIGAIASRLRRIDRTELLVPLSLADQPGEINAILLKRYANFRTKGGVSGAVPAQARKASTSNPPSTGHGRAAGQNCDLPLEAGSTAEKVR